MAKAATKAKAKDWTKAKDWNDQKDFQTITNEHAHGTIEQGTGEGIGGDTMTTRSLREVEVGGWVWIYDKERWNGGPETRRLTKITHIDAKGRLFICTETANDLMENWRYGFKPETGTAKQYENSRIEWASPEEIAQEQERERELERQEQKKDETRRLRRLAEAAAPELLEVLREAYKYIDCKVAANFENGGLLGRMGRAIERAEGQK